MTSTITQESVIPDNTIVQPTSEIVVEPIIETVTTSIKRGRPAKVVTTDPIISEKSKVIYYKPKNGKCVQVEGFIVPPCGIRSLIELPEFEGLLHSYLNKEVVEE
jgi:hypothetical protein